MPLNSCHWAIMVYSALCIHILKGRINSLSATLWQINLCSNAYSWLIWDILCTWQISFGTEWSSCSLADDIYHRDKHMVDIYNRPILIVWIIWQRFSKLRHFYNWINWMTDNVQQTHLTLVITHPWCGLTWHLIICSVCWITNQEKKTSLSSFTVSSVVSTHILWSSHSFLQQHCRFRRACVFVWTRCCSCNPR